MMDPGNRTCVFALSFEEGNSMKRLVVTVCGLFIFLTAGSMAAQIVAEDDASNYTEAGGWYGNGGFGFDDWVIQATVDDGYAGHFLADIQQNSDLNYIMSPNGQAWGLFANFGVFPTVVAYRGFGYDGTTWQHSLWETGDEFHISMEHGGIMYDGAVGFVLRSLNNDYDVYSYNAFARFEFGFIGGTTNYFYVDGNGFQKSSVGWSPNGLILKFRITAGNAYSLEIRSAFDHELLETITGPLEGTSPIDSVALYNRFAHEQDAFFNNMRIVHASRVNPGLRVTIQHVDGLSASDADVMRYDYQWQYVDSRSTDQAGVAFWPAVYAGTYNLEAWYNGEFWGGTSTLVNEGGIRDVTIRRHMPHGADYRVHDGDKDVTGWETVLGSTLDNRVTVTNPGTASQNVRAILHLRRQGSSSVIYTETTTQANVPSGGAETFHMPTFTPTEAGTYERALEVQTYINDGWVKTDSWPWGPVVTMLPDTGELVVTVQDSVGAASTNAIVLRYDYQWDYIDSKITDQYGIASWSEVYSGTYFFQVWYNQEYWGATSAFLEKGDKEYITFQRYMPYGDDYRVLDGDVDVTGWETELGATLANRVTVTNVGTASQSVRVILRLRLRDSSTVLYDHTSPSASVSPNGGATTFYMPSFTPNEAGIYERSLEIQTYYNNEWRKTDSWPWDRVVTIHQNPGSLHVIVLDQNELLREGAEVLLKSTSGVTLDSRVTGTGGKADWHLIEPGTYGLQAWCNQELWGKAATTVVGGTTENVVIRRDMPYGADFQVFDSGDEVTAGTVILGTKLSNVITVTNRSGAAQIARPVLRIRRTSSPAIELVLTNAPQSVPAHSAVSFAMPDFSPAMVDTYQRSLEIQTRVDNKWEKTDGWGWDPYVTVKELSDFSLITPQNGVENAGARPHFSWESLDNATHYEIVVGTALPVYSEVLRTEVTNAFWVPDSGTLQQGTLYTWQVFAKSAGGENVAAENGPFVFHSGDVSIGSRIIGYRQTPDGKIELELVASYVAFQPLSVWVEYFVDDNWFTFTRVAVSDVLSEYGLFYYCALAGAGDEGFPVGTEVTFRIGFAPVYWLPGTFPYGFPPWETRYSDWITTTISQQKVVLTVQDAGLGYLRLADYDQLSSEDDKEKIEFTNLAIENNLFCWVRLYAMNMSSFQALRGGGGGENLEEVFTSSPTWLQAVGNLVHGKPYGPHYVQGRKIDLLQLISLNVFEMDVLDRATFTYLSDETLPVGEIIHIEAFKGGLGSPEPYLELGILNALDTLLSAMPSVIEFLDEIDPSDAEATATGLFTTLFEKAKESAQKDHVKNAMMNGDFIPLLEDLVLYLATDFFWEQLEILLAESIEDVAVETILSALSSKIGLGQALLNSVAGFAQYAFYHPSDHLVLRASSMSTDLDPGDVEYLGTAPLSLQLGGITATNAPEVWTFPVGSSEKIRVRIENSSATETLRNVWLGMDIYAPSDMDETGLLYTYSDKVENTLTPIPDADSGTGRKGSLKFKVVEVDGVATNLDYTANAAAQTLQYLDIPPGTTVILESDAYGFTNTWIPARSETHTYAPGRYMAHVAVWINGYPGATNGISATTVYDSMSIPIHLYDDAPPTSPPSGLEVVSLPDRIAIGWDPVRRRVGSQKVNRDVEWVAVFRSTDPATLFDGANVISIIDSRDPNQFVYDQDVVAGTDYYYGVKAYSVAGLGSPASDAVAGRIPAGILHVTPERVSHTGSVSEVISIGSLMLENQGHHAMNASMTASASWLSLSDSAVIIAPGDSHELDVIADFAALTAGEHSAAITITAEGAEGAPLTVPVHVTKPLGPYLAVSADRTTSQAYGEGVTTVTENLTLQNTGDQVLEWNASGSVLESGNTVSFSKSSGVLSASASESLQYSFDVDTSAHGATYTAEIVVMGNQVNGERVYRHHVAITQEVVSLLISPMITNLDAYGSGENEIIVTANVPWTASRGEQSLWITILADSGSGNGVITFSVDENTNTASRTGIVVVEGGGIAQTGTVIQAGAIDPGGDDGPFIESLEMVQNGSGALILGVPEGYSLARLEEGMVGHTDPTDDNDRWTTLNEGAEADYEMLGSEIRIRTENAPPFRLFRLWLIPD